MRALLAIAATAVVAAAPISTAFAQGYGPGPWRPYGDYGRDPCHEAKHEAGERGAVTGGLLGALAGALVGGRHNRVGGAVVGGAAGAVIGNQVARSNVRCMGYPYGYRQHPNCRWVVQDGHGFEVCRAPDGVWRPWRDHY